MSEFAILFVVGYLYTSYMLAFCVWTDCLYFFATLASIAAITQLYSLNKSGVLSVHGVHASRH